jgi:hypothetical protein
MLAHLGPEVHPCSELGKFAAAFMLKLALATSSRPAGTGHDWLVAALCANPCPCLLPPTHR